MRILHKLWLLCAVIPCLMISCTGEEKSDEIYIDISPADTTIYPRTNGLLSGLFDIGSGVHVRFSQGNLQYQPSTNKWRLAPNQYDYAGRKNAQISATYTKWIDLFAWGTSGCDTNIPPYYHLYNGEITALDPHLLSPVNLYDWGNYIAIPNAGDTAGWLITPTAQQWYYIINQRYRAKEKRGVAEVEGTLGYVLLPDSWVLPNSASFVPDTAENTSSLQTPPYVNVYDKKIWREMESEGAVFLPFCGCRNGHNLIGVNSEGHYWSSTHDNIMQGYCTQVNLNEKKTAIAKWQKGMAIRLIHIEY